MLTVRVESTYTSSERSFDPKWTLEHLKQKLEQITGIPPTAQQLKVSLESGRELDFDYVGKTIADIVPSNIAFLKIEVVDARPPGEQLQLDDSVEKYEISEKDYGSRKNTVLQWKKDQKLGRFAEQPASSPRSSVPQEEAANVGPVGTKCMVQLKSGDRAIGTIRYVGAVAEIPGEGAWVGISLESPLGKNDGTLKGTRYFECKPSHGVFVKPHAISSLENEYDDEL